MTLKAAFRLMKKKGLYYDIRACRRFREKLVFLKNDRSFNAQSIRQMVRGIGNWGIVGYLFNRYYMAHAGCS